MNPTEASLFRQACRVEDHDPLPKVVEDAYWDYKWAKDAIDSSPLRLEEICLIVAISGYAKGRGPRNPDEVTPLDLIKSGAVVDGDSVLVAWKFGHPIVATYRGYAKVRDKVIIQLENEPDTREVEVGRFLGLPEPVEA